MDFVWTYIKDPSFFNKGGIFNELEYSVKSVEKNYDGAVRCFVVGDKPPVDGVIHIPVERVHHTVIQWERHVDQIAKFRAIIDSDINEDFVLIYDDTYLMNKVIEKDITTTYGYNKVDDVEKYIRKWSRTYAMIWKETYRKIAEFRSDLYDWETHLPRYLSKIRLENVINKFNLDENNLISTSLYAAKYAENTVLMGDLQYDLVSWPPKIPLEEGFKRKFMNLMDPAITFEFIDAIKEHLK
jgi:hypothetical protein